MTPRKCRPFTLADGMILIAASAVGLAGHVVVLRMMHLEFGEAEAIPGQLIPFLAAGTFAHVAVRCRKPRPSRRRMMAQPGMVACCTLALSLALFPSLSLTVILGKDLILSRGEARQILVVMPEIFIELANMILYLAGTTVLAVWGVLALGGRWTIEPGWIDQLGVCLGIGWIVTSCGYLIFVY